MDERGGKIQILKRQSSHLVFSSSCEKCQAAIGHGKNASGRSCITHPRGNRAGGKTDLASVASADIYPEREQRVRDMDWEMGGNSPAICGARASLSLCLIL